MAKVTGVCHFLSIDKIMKKRAFYSLKNPLFCSCLARPSKEEKARLADEKNAATGVNKPGTAAVAGDEDAAGEEDDAEGEEE